MATRKKTPKFVVATSFSRGEQWLDQILVICPLHTETVATKLGDSQATIARVLEIGSTDQVTDHGENPIFWSVVQGQLKQATHEAPWVAGRLVRVGNAYRLDGLTDDEQVLVEQALADLEAA